MAMYRMFNASWLSLFEFLSMMEKKRKMLMSVQFIKSITESIPHFLCFMALFVAANWIFSAFHSSLVNSIESTFELH
jgi:hypothetical protein